MIDGRMPAVGEQLYGFCGGAFGRDHYGPCRVEAVGVDWVVVRNDDGSVDFACDDTRPDGWAVSDSLRISNAFDPQEQL